MRSFYGEQKCLCQVSGRPSGKWAGCGGTEHQPPSWGALERRALWHSGGGSSQQWTPGERAEEAG